MHGERSYEDEGWMQLAQDLVQLVSSDISCVETSDSVIREFVNSLLEDTLVVFPRSSQQKQ